MSIEYRLNPSVTHEELNALYAVSWPPHMTLDSSSVLNRALAYIFAYEGERLIGSVYVAWDGSQHAFLVEPTVHPAYRRRGIGKELVSRAVEASRSAGCEWLHVDYGEELTPFYEACGFIPTPAGLIRLATDQASTNP
jgi:GNAT superfamily N-acetyltransferase